MANHRARDPAAWLRVHDTSPLAVLPRGMPYRQEFSDDNGATWADPRPTTAEHTHLAATDAEMDGRRLEITSEFVVTVRLQAGHLVRFTPVP
jgi:hypothetical protein